MKTIFSYMNPLNVINRVRTGSTQEKKIDLTQETFDFEFASNEYLPTFEKWVKGEEQEYYGIWNIHIKDIKLKDIEEIYLDKYQLVQQQQEENLIDYIVQQDDTLFGLELKFNVSQTRILQINEISEDCLVPGMKLKIPEQVNYDQLQDIQFENEEHTVQSYYGRNLMDEIMNKGQTKKCIHILQQSVSVYYVSGGGNIDGILTVNVDVILFDPAVSENNKHLITKCQKQNVLNFQACIMTEDILGVKLVELPTRISKNQEKYFKDYLIQLRITPQSKHKKLIEAFPLLNFRILNDDDQNTFCKKSQELCEALTEVIKVRSEKQLETTRELDLTIIPFYDQDDELLFEHLVSRTNEIWGGQDFLPSMLQQSNILNNDEFIKIICHIPAIFKTNNWTLVYSNIRDGTSYQTLLSKVEYKTPLILVIKDIKDIIFGAYLNEYPKLTFGKFFGNGESFLWTFHQQFEIFKWSEANNYFIFCETDGFAVGCGEKFGLYVNHSLTHGNTNECETFKNRPLTEPNDFIVSVIEIWGLSE